MGERRQHGRAAKPGGSAGFGRKRRGPGRLVRSLAVCACFAAAFPAGSVGEAALHAQEGEERGAIEGTIVGKRRSSSAPLPYALLQGTNGRAYFSATTDSTGHFRVRDLAAGIWTVDVLHVGYRSLRVDVHVPRSGEVSLEVELPWAPVVLPQLTIKAVPVSSSWGEKRVSDLERGEVALRTLEAGTGMAASGLASLVREAPGGGQADPRDVLLLRGAAADLKLVLLDGVPVYTPFHVGGLVEGLDPWVLGNASLFLGGAPARFDGGLSYIMDLRTRAPRRDRIRGRMSADLLGGHAVVEGPLGGSGAGLVSSRALHDLGSSLLDRGPAPYGYADGLLRLDWAFPRGVEASVTGFWNREEVALDLSRGSAPLAGPDEEAPMKETLRSRLPGEKAEWGNLALTGGVRGKIGDARAELRLAGSRYEARLPLGDSLPYFAHGRSGRLRAQGDVTWPLGSGTLRVGGTLDRHANWYFVQRLDPDEPISGRELDTDGESLGAYAEVSRPLVSDLLFHGGMRGDWFSADPGLRLAPRLALTWLLTDEAALTLALGRYHQYLPLPIETVGESVEEPFGGVNPGGGLRTLKVGSADHLVVSLDQLLGPGLRLGLEGFAKEFRGVPGAENNVLKASGVDLRVAREGERFSGWLGYTLTWFWASENDVARNGAFTGRNLLSAGLRARLTDRTGVDLKLGYGGGLPYTSVPISSADESFGSTPSSQLNNERVLNDAPGFSAPPDQSFLRMDAEIYGLFQPALGGREMIVRPYLKVLNALDRRDALFYHFDRWRNEEPRPLAELPVLPLVGVEVRF